MPGIITLTTDFGLKDPYHAAVKGAILCVAPGVRIVDVSHLVRPGNILEGALILRDAAPYFPDKTIHVAVVDPGVGGGRRPVLIETRRYFFIGPDNGVLLPAAASDGIKRVVHLTDNRYFRKDVSSTFHGRDIFGPVAAHLSHGTAPALFGKMIRKTVPLKMPSVRIGGGAVKGSVVYADTFGNLMTNIGRAVLIRHFGGSGLEISIKGVTIKGLSKTYGDVKKGGVAAVIGSTGFLEIAVNRGSAEAVLEAAAAESVTVRGLR